jgi:hypothetical protein
MFTHWVSATSLLKSLNLSVFSVTSVAELQFLGLLVTLYHQFILTIFLCVLCVLRGERESLF